MKASDESDDDESGHDDIAELLEEVDEATEGESGKFNFYNPYLAPADITSAPRVPFGIGRTVQPENFDLREEISDLGRKFGEAIAQKEETFPYT